MAEDKKSFIAYADWDTQLNLLSDEEAGKLFRHLLDYVNDRNPRFNDDERILKVAFEPMRLQLKRDLEKYQEVKRKRAEAGRSGGLKSGETRSKDNQTGPTESSVTINEANEAIASSAKQTETNEAVNVNVNDTVTVTDVLLRKEPKHTLTGEAEEKTTSKTQSAEQRKKVAPKKESELQMPDSFRPLWSEWNEYRKARKKRPYAGEKWEQIAVNKLLKLSNKDPAIAAQILAQSYENSYEGFFELKQTYHVNQRPTNTSARGGQNGKISARQFLAREFQRNAAGHSPGGDCTIDAEVVE